MVKLHFCCRGRGPTGGASLLCALLATVALLGQAGHAGRNDSNQTDFVPPLSLVELKAELKSRLGVLCGDRGKKCKFACRILEAWDAPFELATRIATDERTTADGPDFLLIGTQKGGTTDVYEQLAMKPHFQALGSVRTCSKNAGKKKCAAQKELHFFDWACLHQQQLGRFKGGKRWWCNGIAYASHFKEMRGSIAEPKQLVGEATSNYLYHPEIPRMVKGMFPNVKLIILLRDPVSRAYSGFFQHFHAQGNHTFDEMIDHEIRVIKRCEDLMPLHLHATVQMFSGCIYPLFATEVLEKTLLPNGPWTQKPGYNPNNVCSPAFLRWYAHVTRGLYYFQLLQWLEHYPSEQLLVVKSEEYFEDSRTGIRTIAEFVGGVEEEADAQHVPNTAAGTDASAESIKEIIGTNSKSRGTISNEARTRLQAVYKPYNAMLYKLLRSVGKEFAPWS